MNRPSESADSRPAEFFVRALVKLKESDRKALRRATGRPLGTEVLVYDIFQDIYRPIRRKTPTSKWSFYLVATLYPWNPKRAPTGNFGDAMGHVRLSATRADGRKRTDHRFTRLLDARSRTLSAELISCVRLLAQKRVPVNWVQLVHDLSHWYAPGQKVQKTWAESYFRS